MINDADIIIIGAGAAGLMAAADLSESGKKILILEARQRIGGRILTLRKGQEVLEAGAEFVHGELPLTIQLLRESGIRYHKTGGKMERSKKGEWVRQKTFGYGWSDLLEKMDEMEEDMALGDFLNIYFGGDQYVELRNSVRGYAEGFDLADTSRASTLALYEEWSNESDSQFRIEGGYDKLSNFLFEKCLSNGCKLEIGRVVNRVEWRKDHATVFAYGEKSYHAKKVLVTVPLGVLQQENKIGSIRFSPTLGGSMQLFRDIGYGSVIKILLDFKKPFWEEHQENLGFIFSDQRVPTWWTQVPAKSNLLTGWLGGSIEKIRLASEHDLLELAIDSLSKIFSIAKAKLDEELGSSHIFNWSEDPFSVGAYSFSTPTTKEARLQLREPFAHTLYFAGEALYDGDSPGTVEAALQNGRDVAERIACEI